MCDHHQGYCFSPTGLVQSKGKDLSTLDNRLMSLDYHFSGTGDAHLYTSECLVSVAQFIADCFDHFQSGGDPSYSPALGGWKRRKFLLSLSLSLSLSLMVKP
jgi:hypothetical protein